MSIPTIVIFMISIVLMLGSAVPGQEGLTAYAQYIALLAILTEVGCIHETLKED